MQNFTEVNKLKRNLSNCGDRVSVVPTARMTPQNEYILNCKHNVGSTNLDLKRIEFDLKPIESYEFNFELNPMNRNSDASFYVLIY